MRIATAVAAAVFVLDQVSKYAVVHLMRLDAVGSIEVLPPYLNFRMAWNQGINFGLFSNPGEWMRWVLIAVSIAISVWVWFWVRREAHRAIVQVSAGLLIGGALGNVIDRLVYGAVADFLNMGLPWWDNPYSFNVADISIFAGAFGLVLFAGKEKTA